MSAAEMQNISHSFLESKCGDRCQLWHALRNVHRSFVPIERLKMRNALRWGAVRDGWIALEARAPRFPWADEILEVADFVMRKK